MAKERNNNEVNNSGGETEEETPKPTRERPSPREDLNDTLTEGFDKNNSVKKKNHSKRNS